MVKYSLPALLFISANLFGMTDLEKQRNATLAELKKSIDLWHDKPGSFQAREDWDPLLQKLLEVDYQISNNETYKCEQEKKSKTQFLHEIIAERYYLAVWENLLKKKYERYHRTWFFKWFFKKKAKGFQEMREFRDYFEFTVDNDLMAFSKEGYTGSEWFKANVIILCLSQPKLP